jgi:hypothetical protein
MTAAHDTPDGSDAPNLSEVKSVKERLRLAGLVKADQPRATGPTSSPPPTVDGDYQKRVWGWIQSNADTQAARTSHRHPHQFPSSIWAFRYAIGAGINLDEVEDVLHQAQVDNNAVSDNGERKVRATFSDARATAEKEGAAYLEDRDPPQEKVNAAYTMDEPPGAAEEFFQQRESLKRIRQYAQSRGVSPLGCARRHLHPRTMRHPAARRHPTNNRQPHSPKPRVSRRRRIRHR